ncbi:hypothetical protein FH063_004717 [Azospirillum argentinense]|uniref:Uncharacterized protein n=1 Tax=Azospirillum argentinense TaxID=2970906 RepID=A0A5B0KWY5_9PROT|nr:hypothetical protein FH063_004717 [Azospirillum argentinense]
MFWSRFERCAPSTAHRRHRSKRRMPGPESAEVGGGVVVATELEKLAMGVRMDRKR